MYTGHYKQVILAKKVQAKVKVFRRVTDQRKKVKL